MLSAILALFAVSRSWMPACAARPRAKRTRSGARIASLFGASATTPSITAACRCGLSRTIGAHCASRNGPSSAWASKPDAGSGTPAPEGISRFVCFFGEWFYFLR
uniref:(northern house mosquito) hypothetical protein n=1 Tax=Culex pipiens TaxID=7175 RepID=A0A8D8GB15_CULPI